jgi:hypothetical protein
MEASALIFGARHGPLVDVIGLLVDHDGYMNLLGCLSHEAPAVLAASRISGGLSVP